MHLLDPHPFALLLRALARHSRSSRAPLDFNTIVSLLAWMTQLPIAVSDRVRMVATRQPVLHVQLTQTGRQRCAFEYDNTLDLNYCVVFMSSCYD